MENKLSKEEIAMNLTIAMINSTVKDYGIVNSNWTICTYNEILEGIKVDG